MNSSLLMGKDYGRGEIKKKDLGLKRLKSAFDETKQFALYLFLIKNL